jgi:hypothetical protein
MVMGEKGCAVTIEIGPKEVEGCSVYFGRRDQDRKRERA